MASDYTIKLSLFAKKAILRAVPGQQQGARYGYVTSGLKMPQGFSHYIVEFSPSSDQLVRILAYCDMYGRVFACDEEIKVPPARKPDVGLSITRTANGAEGSVVAFTRGDDIRTLAYYTCDSNESNFNYTRVSAPVPGGFSAGSNLSYIDFMTYNYLSLFLFSSVTDNARRVFNLSDVFDRFDTVNLFGSVSTEVLETQHSWANDPATSFGIERYLVHMLREEGIVGMAAEQMAVSYAALTGKAPGKDDPDTVAPNVRLIRTANYADTYFVDFNYYAGDRSWDSGGEQLNAATWPHRKVLLGTEGALNRFLLLANYMKDSKSAFNEDESFCSQADQWLMDTICTQMADPTSPGQPSGRWDLHYGFSRGCEGLKLPYRLVYSYRTNAQGTALGVDVGCPPADIMPKSRWDAQVGGYVGTTPAERNATESRYATHLALLVAALGFSLSAGIERVCINCTRLDMDKDLVLSAVIDRAGFVQAYREDASRAFADPFGVLGRLGARFGFASEYRMKAVEPLFELDKGDFIGFVRVSASEDETPFLPKVRQAMGVNNAVEMTIFEEGKRRQYAKQVVKALEAGPDEAEACLRGIHDRSEDLTVRSICKTLLDELQAGNLDPLSFLEVESAFVDAYGFRTPMAHATALWKADDPKCVDVLNDLRASVDSMGIFNDTAATCFRYFDSYESRAVYALRCGDDARGRRVMPLPDEMYLVYDLLCQIYTDSIQDNAKAIEYSKRLIEMAPSRSGSYQRAARAYFTLEDYANEAEMCKKALHYVWRPSDAAICYYWIAYAFWKLEKYDAAAACYHRVLMLNEAMVNEAREEVGELFDAVQGLQRRSREQEDRILEREGVPIGDMRENVDWIFDFGTGCIDGGSIALGCHMCYSASRVLRDDALNPSIRSLDLMLKEPE